MDEKRVLQLACLHKGVDVAEVISYRVYEDHIALVVNPGPKHLVPLSELQEAEISMEAEEVLTASEPPRKVNATRGAKKLARERGIDLAAVKGSGLGGRIMQSDVEAML